MSHPDAEKWNGRYRTDGPNWLQNKPRRLLQTRLPHLPCCGLALDAASGVGVNGLALARHGLHVVALDISQEGLRLARQLFAQEGLAVDTAVYDLAHPWFPPNSFDVIINFRFLERATFSAYRRALKPGGWLIFETFVKTDRETEYPAHFLEPGELHRAFADFVVHFSGQEEVVRNGRNYKTTDQFVAQKPITIPV